MYEKMKNLQLKDNDYPFFFFLLLLGLLLITFKFSLLMIISGKYCAIDSDVKMVIRKSL